MTQPCYLAPRPAVGDPGLVRPDWTKGSARDPQALWLDKNENGDPILAEVLRGVIASLPPETWWTYPEPTSLYAKLAGHAGVPAGRLLLAAGSDGAIRSVFEAFVSPGDVVVHTAPTFAMYPVYCRIYGADAVPVAYEPSPAGPLLTTDRLIETIAARRPRLVCLPNPDSPTGTILSLADMARVIDAAEAAGAVMLVDEAYYPFHPDTVLPWVMDRPNLVVTRSTGKAWGMAGLRIGYAAASEGIVGFLHKVRAMYETSTVAMAALERMLDHEDAMRASVVRLEAGKAAFLAAMEGCGFRVLRGRGNFLHVAFGSHAEAIHAGLRDRVYYRPDFREPCLAGFSRFSATTVERFQPVIDHIRSLLENQR